MKYWSSWCVTLVLALALSAAAGFACPNCKDQVPIQKTADGRQLVDPKATNRAYALSIYFLLSSVYGIPLVLCTVLWRSMRSVEARRRRERASKMGIAVRPAAPVEERCDDGLSRVFLSPAKEAGS